MFSVECFNIISLTALKMYVFTTANGHLKISRTWTAEMEMDKLSRDNLMRDN